MTTLLTIVTYCVQLLHGLVMPSYFAQNLMTVLPAELNGPGRNWPRCHSLVFQSVCADWLLGAAVCLLGAGKPERHVSLFGRLQCVGGGTGARARHFMLMIIRLTSGAS